MAAMMIKQKFYTVATEKAWVVDNHNLHYYVAGLSSPDYLWPYGQGGNGGSDADRYVTLYTATGVAPGHSLEQYGLV
ncbi:hypothetical protein F5Y00DRAFT_262850 [Daldinia vernicosa]|uniref:uncharacterized protein n=1 Tax=Daldinia vernicosa TaxID=114800 RepID=UPI00200781EF|nr:uncharacterized protein F5Y00DRAFT_262850 [Daldinia vernicosa]KAI0848214.1 hypothetical protein F5Y00DRAFT_262850 [Daldinia vernicosa]